MSTERRVVEMLPVLNQTGFPEIPEIPEGKPVTILGSPFQNMEKEAVLGIMTTVAARTGGWRPVSAEDFLKVMLEMRLKLFAQEVINAMWELAGDGLVEIVTHDGKDFIVPSAQFAQNIGQGRLMVM